MRLTSCVILIAQLVILGKNKMKKFLIDFIKSNPFLFSCIILTTLIPLYYSLDIAINFFPPYKNKWYQFWDLSVIIIPVQIIGYFFT